jgi:hypothetical protein
MNINKGMGMEELAFILPLTALVLGSWYIPRKDKLIWNIYYGQHQ